MSERFAKCDKCGSIASKIIDRVEGDYMGRFKKVQVPTCGRYPYCSKAGGNGYAGDEELTGPYKKEESEDDYYGL